MGIRGMNRFMRMFCPEAIRIVDFSALRGKRIAFDMSVYMYRFKKEKTLVVDMFTLMHHFKDNGIVPLFVFDGEPPKEKTEELKERRRIKEEAIKRYETLKQEILEKGDGLTGTAKEEKAREMTQLEKEFISLKNSDIRTMRALIVAFGFSYVFACGEADTLCAALELSGAVDAVMSEDGDMVAYGCSTILRVPNLVMGTCELFDVAMVRKMLGITPAMLREMCVLSGTDYNTHLAASSGAGSDSDGDSETELDGKGGESGSGSGSDSSGGSSAVKTMDFFTAYSTMNALRGGTTIQDLSADCVPLREMSILAAFLETKKIDSDTYEVHKKTAGMYELESCRLKEAINEYGEAMEAVQVYNVEKIKECLKQNGVLIC